MPMPADIFTGEATHPSVSAQTSAPSLNISVRLWHQTRAFPPVLSVGVDNIFTIIKTRGNSQCVFVTRGERPPALDESISGMWSKMSRKQDRFTSRPRSLTSHYGSSPSMLGSVLGNQYGSYANSSYSSFSPTKYRNYNPYSTGFGRSSSNLGIYGGTSSGYGGVYLGGSSLGSLNLMTPVLKKLDKRLLASQKNFKPKPVPPAKVQETPPEDVAASPVPAEAVVASEAEAPPVRPERKSRANRAGCLSMERSRSLNSLDTSGGLGSRSLSLNSLASDGYCVRFILFPNPFFICDIKKLNAYDLAYLRQLTWI